jgi:hypothetical protein
MGELCALGCTQLSRKPKPSPLLVREWPDATGELVPSPRTRTPGASPPDPRPQGPAAPADRLHTVTMAASPDPHNHRVHLRWRHWRLEQIR